MKTFEEHVRDGTNNSKNCLLGLLEGKPALKQMLDKVKVIIGADTSEAGLREDVQKVLTTTIPVKTAQERLRAAVDNLKRCGGMLHVDIKHPNDLSEYPNGASKSGTGIKVESSPHRCWFAI